MVYITIEIRYIFQEDYDSTYDLLSSFCSKNKIEMTETNRGLRLDDYIYATSGKEGEEFIEYTLEINDNNMIIPTLKFLEKEAIHRTTPLSDLL